MLSADSFAFCSRPELAQFFQADIVTDTEVGKIEGLNNLLKSALGMGLWELSRRQRVDEADGTQGSVDPP